MKKVLSKEERKELRKAMEKICDLAGTAFICCNIRESEEDENGKTLSCINGKCGDVGQSIATALRGQKELKEAYETYSKAGELISTLKGLLDDIS